MSGFTKPEDPAVFVEFTEATAHMAAGDRAFDVALDRDVTGALMPTAIESLRNSLKMLSENGRIEHAICLLPARGISIRRISLPLATSDKYERLIPLQIDAQFPLTSEELAWGYAPLRMIARSTEGPLSQDFLIVALKKDSVQQYQQVVESAGLTPRFAVAALARLGLCPETVPKFATIEIGPNQSELVTFDESGPTSLRVVALGAEHLSEEPLLSALQSNGAIQKIYVTGRKAAIWSARISPSIPAEPVASAHGQSAAIAGVRQILRSECEPIFLRANRDPAPMQRAPAQWRWAAVAGLLLLAYLGLRYAEPIIQNRRLNRTIAELQARRAKLPKIDRETAFLNYIHTNQPNYLEVIGALASATQPGTKLDALTISKRGDVSMRGSAQNGQAPSTLRSKMIDSGFFSSVVLDEQTPVQNQQQVNFRMTAQLRPEPERKTPTNAKPTSSAAATNKPPTNATPAKVSPAPPPTALSTEGAPQ